MAAPAQKALRSPKVSPRHPWHNTHCSLRLSQAAQGSKRGNSDVKTDGQRPHAAIADHGMPQRQPQAYLAAKSLNYLTKT